MRIVLRFNRFSLTVILTNDKTATMAQWIGILQINLFVPWNHVENSKLFVTSSEYIETYMLH